MTVREMIKQSLDRIDLRDEAPEDYDGQQEPMMILPMAFTELTENMARLLVWVCADLLSRDVPSYKLSGGERRSGKAKAAPSPQDIADVLSGVDLGRHMHLFRQLHGFYDWWLDQEARTEDPENFWMDMTVIAEAWNEYASKNN